MVKYFLWVAVVLHTFMAVYAGLQGTAEYAPAAIVNAVFAFIWSYSFYEVYDEV